jgi:hypothetical protein
MSFHPGRSPLGSVSQEPKTTPSTASASSSRYPVLPPWLAGFSGEQTAAWTAWISGALIAIVAAIALAELRQWEEWVNGLPGLFVAVSPWILGFAGLGRAHDVLTRTTGTAPTLLRSSRRRSRPTPWVDSDRCMLRGLTSSHATPDTCPRHGSPRACNERRQIRSAINPDRGNSHHLDSRGDDLSASALSAMAESRRSAGSAPGSTWVWNPTDRANPRAGPRRQRPNRFCS